MATASCGSISVNGYRFYNGGWSSTTYASLKASYSQTSKYVTVDKITLPSFTNAKFVAPYTLTLSIPVVANNTSNTLYVYLCSSDPGSTKIYATSPSPSQAPSSYIGSGSVVMNHNSSSSKNTSVTVNISSTDLSSGGTYYLWIQTSKLSQIHYKGTPSGTLTGTVATYKISYNANGGSGAPSAQTKTYGTDLTLSSTKPTRTGYTFAGWSTSKTGSVAYAAGGKYTTNASATLYAIWTANVVRLAYNINGGTMGNTAEYGLNDYKFITKGGTWVFHTISYGSSSDPYNASTFQLTRTGYSFGGWNSYLSSGGIQSTLFDQNTSYDSTKYHGIGGTTVTTANTSSLDCYLYAKWNANSYTVTYNANGGSGSMAADTVYYNSSYKTKQNAFTRTGYTFAGWNEKADGTGTAWNANTSGTYENGTAWTWTYTKNITLYAQWTVNSYTCTIDPNGGTYKNSRGKNATAVDSYTFKGNHSYAPIAATSTSAGVTSPSSDTGIVARYYISKPTKTGYTFSSWTPSPSSVTITSYSFGAGAMYSSKGNPQCDFTATAKWTANTYTVKYYGNGATSGTTADSSHTYDTSKKLTSNGYERKGYEFLGWATSSTGDVVYTNQQSVKNLTTSNGGTVKLYAVWKPLSQMFIWHDNEWHRALRYVYNTSS